MTSLSYDRWKKAPPTYTLVLLATGPKPVWVIKLVRDLLPDTSISVVKPMIENPPAIVRSGLFERQAQYFVSEFRRAGAEVKLVEHQSDERIPPWGPHGAWPR